MKYAIFLITILSSVGFFNPHGMFSDQLLKLMFYLSCLGALGIALFEGISLRNVQYPRKAYAVLLIGIAVSVIPATAFHMQGFTVSVMTVLPYIFAYSFFYALMKLNLPEKKIMNTYLVLCGISCIVYFCNVATMPNNMFGAPIIGLDDNRGIIRIPVVFIEFFPMVVFYAINQWFITKKKIWWVVMGVAGLLIILSVIRQIIALTAVLGLLFLLRKLSWKFKVLMSAAVIAIVVFVLPMIPMYQTMLELSEKQKEENEEEENIRIQAWRYYTYENQTNAITPFIGNGMPSFGNSRWGVQMESEFADTGCLFVDVGWAGFFWLFGGISLIALMTLTIKALLKKKSEDKQYLNYWLIFFLITSCASGPPVIYYQILDIMVCFYLVFQKSDDSEATVSATQPLSSQEEKDSSKQRYPQLAKHV